MHTAVCPPPAINRGYRYAVWSKTKEEWYTLVKVFSDDDAMPFGVPIPVWFDQERLDRLQELLRRRSESEELEIFIIEKLEA